MKKVIRIALPILLIAFLLNKIVSGWDTVSYYIQRANPLLLLIGFLIYLSIYPQAAIAWHKTLIFLGQKIDVFSSLRTWIVSNTGRYIPGAIWQYIGRVELAYRTAKIKRLVVVQSVFFEALATLTAAFLVSGLLGKYLFLLAPLVFLLLHPKVSSIVLTVAKKLTKRDLALPSSYKFIDVLSLLPWFVINFFLNGLALMLVVSSIGEVFTIDKLVFVTAAFAFSWAMGYLVIFVPAGLGVADLTLATLLAIIFPSPLAAFLAIAHRFFLTIAEFVIFGIILLTKRK